MEHITKVQRNDHGEIISFQTSSGRIISYQKAIIETESGVIQGTNIVRYYNGNVSLLNNNEDDLYFKSYPSIF